MSRIEKARFWWAVLYPENMISDWEECLGDILQYPYAYCKHTADRDSKSEHRKDHVHIMLVFPNTTTYNHAKKVFDLLSAEGKQALNTCQAVVGIRNAYDYLIHDTETCKKQGKEKYSPEERVTGNNFDIGAYEQLGVAEKNEMCKELCNAIIDNGFTNFADFYIYVISTYEDSNYFEVLKTYSGLLERLTRGNYQKWEMGRMCGNDTPSQAQVHENTTSGPLKCCPECGSVELKKKGKTVANTQRWQCKDCGKKFV